MISEAWRKVKPWTAILCCKYWSGIWSFSSLVINILMRVGNAGHWRRALASTRPALSSTSLLGISLEQLLVLEENFVRDKHTSAPESCYSSVGSFLSLSPDRLHTFVMFLFPGGLICRLHANNLEKIYHKKIWKIHTLNSSEELKHEKMSELKKKHNTIISLNMFLMNNQHNQ